jgi:hypothetical protein
MVYVIQVCRQHSGRIILILLECCLQTCMTYTIAECTVKKTHDDGQTNCPKHVEFHAKNKCVKLMHLVGFIIKKFVTMYGHMNVKFITMSSLHLVLFLSCVEYWQSVNLRGYTTDLLQTFFMNSGCVRV